MSGADRSLFQQDFSIKSRLLPRLAGSVALVNQTVAFIADDKTGSASWTAISAVEVSNLAVDRDLAAESRHRQRDRHYMA